MFDIWFGALVEALDGGATPFPGDIVPLAGAPAVPLIAGPVVVVVRGVDPTGAVVPVVPGA
jgi:hypothetical protein